MKTNSPIGFRITGGKGFHVTFENGYTVSVQFGGGGYCENYDEPIGDDDWRKQGARGSCNAETAVWGPDGNMISMDGDDTVQGYQGPAEVLALMNWAASQPRPTPDAGGS